MKQEWFDRINGEIKVRLSYARQEVESIVPPCSWAESAVHCEKAAAELLKAAHDFRLMHANRESLDP